MNASELDNLSPDELRGFNSYVKPEEGDIYIFSQPLKDAIKAAIMLQMPLLITGEPGTGKTTLAHKVAKELSAKSNGLYRKKPFSFSTKSNSVASDLFYTYDAIAHFFDANIARHELRESKGVENYISLQALGKAIVASLPSEERKNVKARNIVGLHKEDDDHAESRNSVVLIDEIDKAPRDFPNDILNEIENYRFRIKEAEYVEYEKAEGTHILLIMTSNSEKALPEPFLRRCIFFHIDFPGKEDLKKILRAHRVHYKEPSEDLLEWATTHFIQLRNDCKEKKPATAELVHWVRYLAAKNFNHSSPDHEVLKNSLGILIKNQDDLKKACTLKWLQKENQ